MLCGLLQSLVHYQHRISHRESIDPSTPFTFTAEPIMRFNAKPNPQLRRSGICNTIPSVKHHDPEFQNIQVDKTLNIAKHDAGGMKVASVHADADID